MAPPVNDNFASAIALSTTLPGSRIGDTNVDATEEVGESDAFFGEDDGRTVWYTFTPTSTGRYVFRIDNARPAGQMLGSLGSVFTQVVRWAHSHLYTRIYCQAQAQMTERYIQGRVSFVN